MLTVSLFLWPLQTHLLVSYLSVLLSASYSNKIFGIDLCEIQYNQDSFNTITIYEGAWSPTIRWVGRGVVWG